MKQPPVKIILSHAYKFIDIRQPEVKWAAGVSIILTGLFFAFPIYSDFATYEDEICSLIQCIIAGAFGLIGVSIAGIAIVITLFTVEQIQMLEKLQAGAFDDLLYDFKWFALIASLEISVFVATLFIIRSPYPLVPKPAFYLIVFVLIYSVFYLVFYGYSLIGNFIKMSKLKQSLSTIPDQIKSTPVQAMELQLNFLVSKLVKGNKDDAKLFYTELIEIVEESSISNRDEIAKYLKEHHRF